MWVCTQTHIYVNKHVTHLVGERKVADVAFLDFNKAFNSILLNKLSNCGMSGFMVHWEKNCLKGRAQRGVPQGSILGLVLLYIFINGLNERVEHTFSKFAHDTRLGGAVESLERQEALQRDLGTGQ